MLKLFCFACLKIIFIPVCGVFHLVFDWVYILNVINLLNVIFNQKNDNFNTHLRGFLVGEFT